MGLRGMSERLAAVGGQLEVRPSGHGFRLVATVPADTASRDRTAHPAIRAEALT
jgi:signal transduction histidine kinase